MRAPLASGIYGYATDDIFYLEVCLFNQICTNGAELFTLDEGQEWTCAFDPKLFRELQAIITVPPVFPEDAEECDYGSANPKSGGWNG